MDFILDRKLWHSVHDPNSQFYGWFVNGNGEWLDIDGKYLHRWVNEQSTLGLHIQKDCDPEVCVYCAEDKRKTGFTFRQQKKFGIVNLNTIRTEYP